MGPSMLILHIDGPMGVSIHVDKNDHFCLRKVYMVVGESMSNIDSPMSSDSMEHECEASMLDMDSQPSMEHTSPIHTDGKQKDRPHKRPRSRRVFF